MVATSTRLDRRATAALLYAGTQAAFVVFVFLPAVASIPVPSLSHVHVLDHNVRLHGGRTGRFLPLLLVKPPGSTGPLKISQAPASLIDLRATICEATKTCAPPPDGVSVLSLSEHASRKRTFIAYGDPRGVAARNSVRPEDIQTFSLSGSVEDLDKVTDSAGGRLR